MVAVVPLPIVKPETVTALLVPALRFANAATAFVASSVRVSPETMPLRLPFAVIEALVVAS